MFLTTLRILFFLLSFKEQPNNTPTNYSTYPIFLRSYYSFNLKTRIKWKSRKIVPRHPRVADNMSAPSICVIGLPHTKLLTFHINLNVYYHIKITTMVAMWINLRRSCQVFVNCFYPKVICM